ncbi:hypothetical protein SLEP1_g38012 [Rubroshorea leprosula]|uniref:Uncharacterized protein n=1 Tax=Rubroshorea leprosula TaxID=152421 RepID=A0AAV5KWU1_9ROSI|nr:hypothetical protein SLEP1_g38012 [Rubroshorea leprosula]
MSYLNKIKEHSNALIDALRKLDQTSPTNVQSLAMEAVQYQTAMLEYTKKRQSEASSIFSKWIKEKGWTFDELVKRYQAMLGLNRPFKNLKEVEKLQFTRKLLKLQGGAEL